jgi:hypothetical protein
VPAFPGAPFSRADITRAQHAASLAIGPVAPVDIQRRVLRRAIARLVPQQRRVVRVPIVTNRYATVAVATAAKKQNSPAPTPVTSMIGGPQASIETVQPAAGTAATPTTNTSAVASASPAPADGQTTMEAAAATPTNTATASASSGG